MYMDMVLRVKHSVPFRVVLRSGRPYRGNDKCINHNIVVLSGDRVPWGKPCSLGRGADLKAANAIRTKKLTHEGARRRGRWRNITSLAVYDKEHLWVRSRAQMSLEDFKRGAWIREIQAELAWVWISIYRDAFDPTGIHRMRDGRPATVRERSLFADDDGDEGGRQDSNTGHLG